MKLKTILRYLAALLVIALPLVMTGNGGAGYLWDGAVQNPVTGGWVTPSDMVCIKGVRTNGDLDMVAGTPNSRECIYYNEEGLKALNPVDVTASTTLCGGNPCNVQASCTGTNTTTRGSLTWVGGTQNKCYDSAPCTVAGFTGGLLGGITYPANDGARHAVATSICVDSDGIGIPLTDLDRTAHMCAAKGGIWKQTSATAPSGFAGTFPTPGFGGACVAFGRQFAGQDAVGTPLPFGTKGTSYADAGFCYAAMNMTSAGYTSSTCPSTSTNPSTAYDWSFSSSRCVYAKGVKGYLNAALRKVDGTTAYAANTFVDLSTVAPTMGQCLAIGASWNNWLGASANDGTGTFGKPALGWTTVLTTPSPAFNSLIPNWDFTKQAPETTQGCLRCHSSLIQYNGPFERQKDTYLNHGHRNILRKVTAGKKWAGPDADGVLKFYTSAASGPINFDTATAKIDGVDKPLLYIFGDWMTPAPGGLHTIVDMFGVAKADGISSELCASCHTTGWNNPSAGVCSLSSQTTEGACTAAIDPVTGTNAKWYPMIGVMGIGIPGFSPAEPLASFPGTSFTGAGKWDLDGVQCARCHNATAPAVTSTKIAASAFPSTHATAGGMGSFTNGVGRTNICFGCHQNIAKRDNGTGADADLEHPEKLQVTNTATAPNYVPEFEGRGPGNMFLNSPHARFTGDIVPNSLGNYDLKDTTGNENGNASKYKSKFQGSNCWQSPTSSSPASTMIVGGEIHEIKTKADCENLYGAGSWRPQLISGVAATQGTCSTCHNVHNSIFVKEQKEAAFWKVCTDCHNKSLTGRSINHPTGPGTPLGDHVGTAEEWEACATCHMPRATPSGLPSHLWRINTNKNYSTFPTATEFGIGAASTKKIANATPDGSYTNAVWNDIDRVCGQCHGGSLGPTATKNGAQHYTKARLSMFAKNMHNNPPPTVSFTTDINGDTVTLTDTSTDDWMFPDNAVTVKWGDGTTSTGNAGKPFSHTYAKSKKYKIEYSIIDSYGNKKIKKQTVNVKFSIAAAKK